MRFATGSPRPTKNILNQFGPKLDGKRFGLFIPLFSLLALFSALFLGLLASVLPWFYFLGILSLLLFFVFAWRLPEYSALLLIAVVSGLLPERILGHTASLLLTVGLLVLVLAKHLRDKQMWWPGIKPFVLPFFLLMFFVAIGVVRAIMFQSTPKNYIFDEMTPFLYWLIFPVIALSLNSARRLNAFVVVLLLIAAYIAVGQFIQAIFGIEVFFSGRLEQAETLGKEYSGVMRSVTGSILLLLLGLFISIALYLVRARNFLLFPFMALCAAGLMFTYGRTLMAVSVISLLVITFMLGAKRIYKLAISSGIAIVIVISVLAVYKPDILFAVQDRLLSVQTELKSGDSLTYRLIENRTALPKVIDNPLIGIGLGHDYRQPMLAITPGNDADTQSRFIHNGYLYVALKLGIPALICYLLFITVYFVQARKTIRLLTDTRHRAFLAASTGLMVMPLFTSLTRPEWMTASSTGVFAICFGLLVALRNLQAES
jgi:O-antigen ligase